MWPGVSSARSIRLKVRVLYSLTTSATGGDNHFIKQQQMSKADSPIAMHQIGLFRARTRPGFPDL